VNFQVVRFKANYPYLLLLQNLFSTNTSDGSRCIQQPENLLRDPHLYVSEKTGKNNPMKLPGIKKTA